jgi:hypothetical protein
MKLLKSSFLAFLMVSAASLTFISCGDDDTCAQADWVGNYIGDGSVEEDNVVEMADAASVTITASGTDDIVVSYSYTIDNQESSITFDPFAASGCTISQSATDPNAGVSIDMTLSLDGDDITLESEMTGGGFNSTVTITASK